MVALFRIPLGANGSTLACYRHLGDANRMSGAMGGHAIQCELPCDFCESERAHAPQQLQRAKRLRAGWFERMREVVRRARQAS